MSREAKSDNPFVDFAAGSTILREGEAASALFIIEAGKVEIGRSDAPGIVLAERGPGEFFGEMSILQEQAHSANVVARTAVRALRIDAVAFHGVLRENVEIAMHMMRQLVLRLRESDTRRIELEAQLARSLGSPRAAAMPASAPAAARANAPAGAPIAAPPAAKPASTPVAKPEAVSPPVVTLAAVKPAEVKRVFVLRHAEGAIALPEDRNECVVGRPDPATGAIPEINLGPLDLARSLSRRHARLLVAAGGISLREEPGVSNGTWINGERLAVGQTVALKPGDKLRFGAIELELGLL